MRLIAVRLVWRRVASKIILDVSCPKLNGFWVIVSLGLAFKVGWKLLSFLPIDFYLPRHLPLILPLLRLIFPMPLTPSIATYFWCGERRISSTSSFGYLYLRFSCLFVFQRAIHFLPYWSPTGWSSGTSSFISSFTLYYVSITIGVFFALYGMVPRWGCSNRFH